jgi:hypothetical protein
MSRSRVALSVLAVAVAVPVTLVLPSGPAVAGLPARWTTYKDSHLDVADDAGTMTIKVGRDPHKIARIVIVADCDGTKERFTRRNVPIRDDGRFSVSGGRYVSIEGKFWTAHRAAGSLTTNQCGFFGGDFSATD